MIYLKQNNVNTVILTLTEKTTITSPFYLFEFISDSTNQTVYFTGSDISTNKTRYNEFNIELTTGAADLLNSVLNLDPNGFYSYSVYSQESPTNLDINNITELVETGKVYVVPEFEETKTVYLDGQKTKIVYGE